MAKLGRLILKHLRLAPEGTAAAPARQSLAFRHASSLVLCFYVLQMTALTGTISSWERLAKTAFVKPVWVIALLDGVLAGHTASFCNVLFLLGTVAAVLFHKKRWARLAFFVGVFLSVALQSSFGKIDHGNHLTIILAFVFVFLPDTSRAAPRTTRQKYLTVFVGAQAAILSIYSLAGFWKVAAAFETKAEGVLSLFSPGAFPAQIAASLVEKQAESGPGLFLISHPHLAWALGLAGVFFELFALSAVLRPRLHVVFGTALIFLHLGAILFMRIHFTSNIVYLALFLAASPFRPDFDLRKALASLPLVSWLASSRRPRRAADEPAPVV